MKNINTIICLLFLSLQVMGQSPIIVASGLFDSSDANTLGLSKPEGLTTVSVYKPTVSSTYQFVNGVAMIGFKGALYCMWQTSKTDEDASETWVAYARSVNDGLTWSEPMVLCPSLEGSGYTSSGGWLSTSDMLIGFINVWPTGINSDGGYTQYVQSNDGVSWTSPQDVTMSDGSRLNGIFEQDPHVISSGRIVNAAHFQPGLKVMPIYTDDPTGRSGWHKGNFAYSGTGTQSNELEPSLFERPSDKALVMLFRDQGGSSYMRLAAVSEDQGETWTNAVKTNYPDSRSKQSAGNLPDGTCFISGNPAGNKNRKPLTVGLSADGITFDHAWLLRDANEVAAGPRYSGKAKRSGYGYCKSLVAGDYLYVCYSTNKEDVEYSRVPLKSIALIAPSKPTGINEISSSDNKTIKTYNLLGQQVNENYRNIIIKNGKKYFKY